jgi:hypothetical protein
VQGVISGISASRTLTGMTPYTFPKRNYPEEKGNYLHSIASYYNLILPHNNKMLLILVK